MMPNLLLSAVGYIFFLNRGSGPIRIERALKRTLCLAMALNDAGFPHWCVSMHLEWLLWIVCLIVALQATTSANVRRGHVFGWHSYILTPPSIEISGHQWCLFFNTSPSILGFDLIRCNRPWSILLTERLVRFLILLWLCCSPWYIWVPLIWTLIAFKDWWKS
jgi:hypothetical protein